MTDRLPPISRRSVTLYEWLRYFLWHRIKPKVRLWTIQSPAAWRTLERTGSLAGEKNSKTWQEFLPAYQWMRSQMLQRLDDKPAKLQLPIWAWYQWEGRRKHPDLRARQGARGESLVLIEFDADKDHILLSDFDLWHFVLNGIYLPNSKSDERSFEAAVKRSGYASVPARDLPKNLKLKTRKSWERIFDCARSKSMALGSSKSISIQATLWSLQLEQVLRVRAFRSK